MDKCPEINDGMFRFMERMAGLMQPCTGGGPAFITKLVAFILSLNEIKRLTICKANADILTYGQRPNAAAAL